MEEVNEHCFHVVRAINYGTTFEDDVDSVNPEYIANWTNLDMHTIVKALRVLIEQKHVLEVQDEESGEGGTYRLTAKGRRWVQTS